MINSIVAKITEVIGFDLSNERSDNLEKKISSVVSDLNLKGLSSLYSELSEPKISQKVIISIARHFTIGETYFFRDPYLMKALEKELIFLIDKKKNTDNRIRIWSAGSSSGEEIYSIMIILDRLLADPENWEIYLLGTDINTDAINKAKTGIYSSWSFRSDKNLPNSKYFNSCGNEKFELAANYRNRVRFHFLNFIDGVYPSAIDNIYEFDIIICRNVLMYFSDEVRVNVIKKLRECLSIDGFLCVSPTESIHPYFKNFSKVSHDNVTLYRKRSTTEVEFQNYIMNNVSSTNSKRKITRRSTQPIKPRNLDHLKSRISQTNKKPVTPAKDDLKDEALKNKIKSLYDRSKYGEVESVIEKAGEKENIDGKVWEYYIKACAIQRKNDKALKKLNEMIEKDRINPEYYYLLGNLFFEIRKTEEAFEAYQKASYLDEEHIQTLIAVGNIYFSRGLIAKAIKHLETAKYLLVDLPSVKIIDEVDNITAGELLNVTESILGLVLRKNGTFD